MKNVWNAVKAEYKKIRWPKGKELLVKTGVVIGGIVVIGALTFALDKLYSCEQGNQVPHISEQRARGLFCKDFWLLSQGVESDACCA